MRRYELMLLLRPDLEDDKLQAAVEKVTRAIVNGGGSLSKVSPWGKRRLAYDIGRHREASYFLIHFDIEPAQIREIERGMLITEEILRHLVTVLEERESTDELAPAATPRPDAEGFDEVLGTDAADDAGDAGDAEAGDERQDEDERPAAGEPAAVEADGDEADGGQPTGGEPVDDEPGEEPVSEERAAG